MRTRTREPQKALPPREVRPPEPTVAAAVREQTHCTWSRARDLCTEGRVTVNGQRCLDSAVRVPEGAVVVVDEKAPKLRTGALPESAILYYDRDIVVVDKPVGMLSIAYEPGDKDTLADCTRILLRRIGAKGMGRDASAQARGPAHGPAPRRAEHAAHGPSPLARNQDRPARANEGSRAFDPELGVVHRLDKETSGVMMFTRTLEAKRIMAERFRAHDIDRVYHAIAHGNVPARRIETHLITDRGDGLRGSFGHFRRPKGGVPPEAKRSITHVRPLEALAGATLVECRLETGRQHQIRIHLSELGHPLVGERVYIRDFVAAGGRKIEAMRPMLHARTLGFVHPRTGERMSFEREPPADFMAMYESLRLTRR